MKKLTIGVVGAGIYGNYHIHTYCCDKNVERVVFCDLNEERRIATADKYQITGYKTVKEMIAQEQLDAIILNQPKMPWKPESSICLLKNHWLPV